MTNKSIAISIVETTNRTRSMVKANSTGRAAIDILAHMSLTNAMALVRCIGLMAPRTRVSGSTVPSMVMVNFTCQMERLKKVYLRTMFTRGQYSR